MLPDSNKMMMIIASSGKKALRNHVPLQHSGRSASVRMYKSAIALHLRVWFASLLNAGVQS